MSDLKIDTPEHPTWYKPNKWNQGGYDAFYIDAEHGHVRIVQITRSTSHSLKIEYFQKLITNLNNFQILNLEIIFLVPEDKISSFNLQVKNVSGQGLLAEFGYEKMKEHDRVKIVGLKSCQK